MIFTAVTLAASGCSAAQSNPDARVSSPSVPAFANFTPSAPQETSKASSLAEPPGTTPSSGTPKQSFCAAAAGYLSKFPAIPGDGGPGSEQQGSRGCGFGGGDPSKPAVLLGAISLTTGPLAATSKGQCEAREIPAPFVKVTDSWIQAPGWSAFVSTNQGIHYAKLCTGSHLYNSTILNVAGSTQDDALNLIRVVID
ncbi:hypothetical protein [Arthrobacter sp. SPG23]|uniref:hypothetical protein n=1 Tax=Arthrobacter sp. SPG23 TaxID=1610703 RepID=UPI0011867194|nr:hypothetical protein [Arthrobacter sp. SPG23]